MRNQLQTEALSITDIDRATKYLKKKGFCLDGLVFSKDNITVEVTNLGFNYKKGQFAVNELSVGELIHKIRQK